MLEEMAKIRNIEKKTGKQMPLPNFFYIEKYGRSAQMQIPELLSKLGQEDWFYFKTDCRMQNSTLIQGFNVEMGKYADIGKEYKGCALIEWEENILENPGLFDFLEFLQSKEDIYCIFTMKQCLAAEEVEKAMEQYFFLRKIEAKAYSAEEMMLIVAAACVQYKFKLSEEARLTLAKGLERFVWETDDNVELRLKNAVYEVVYESMMEEDSVFDVTEAEEFLLRLKGSGNSTRMMGFRP